MFTLCLHLVKRVDVCTFSFLYSDGSVARPGDGPGGEGVVQKGKSAKNGRNQPVLPSIVMYSYVCTSRGAAAATSNHSITNCFQPSYHIPNGSPYSPFNSEREGERGPPVNDRTIQ